MWSNRKTHDRNTNPVRIGGRKTVLSLVVIAIIALLLLVIIRFTLL
jgi:hypothetical protein